MTRAEWAKVNAAKELLGLNDRATLAEIKSAYRVLSKKYHPDTKGGDADKPEDNRKMLELNAAYKVLLDYCAAFRFPLQSDGDSESPAVEDWWMDRFGQDPLWGSPAAKDQK